MWNRGEAECPRRHGGCRCAGKTGDVAAVQASYPEIVGGHAAAARRGTAMDRPPMACTGGGGGTGCVSLSELGLANVVTSFIELIQYC